jgi:hypothetical protein
MEAGDFIMEARNLLMIGLARSVRSPTERYGAVCTPELTDI